MGKLKTAWRVVRQTFVVLLITLVLAEIAFRIYNYINPSFVFYDSSYNRFRGKPGAPDYDSHLNSKGFKDVEFKPHKDDGVYRVVALGDSFAFGVVPYRYVYLTRLEEILNQSGKKTEIINMGIVKTGPKDYLALLVNEGVDLNPDMVLVSFFIGNDFEERRQERTLYSYSYVASFIDFLLTVSRDFEGKILDPDFDYNDTEPTFSDEMFVALERKRSEIYRKQNGQFEADLARALDYLIQIKQQCDLRHIALAIALVPDELQINRAVQSKVLEVKALNSAPDDFDFTRPNRLLAGRLKELNIECIDLLDDFTRNSTHTALYKPNDTHWNIAGNELAARIFAEKLFHLAPPATGATDKPATQPKGD